MTHIGNEISPALTERELKLLAEVWLLQVDGTPPKRTHRKETLTPNKLVQYLLRAPMLDKQFINETPVYGLKSNDLRAEIQRTLESHPEWRQRVGRTLALLDGIDSLAALEALVHALQICQDPGQRRCFPMVWAQVQKRLDAQSK